MENNKSSELGFDGSWVDECVEEIYKNVIDKLVEELPRAKETGNSGVSYRNIFRDEKRNLMVMVSVSIEDCASEEWGDVDEVTSTDVVSGGEHSESV